jgi:hypothetical protein
MVNRYLLALSNEDIYNLANEAAKANQNGIKPEVTLWNIIYKLRDNSLFVDDLLKEEAMAQIGQDRARRVFARVHQTRQLLEDYLSSRQQ